MPAKGAREARPFVVEAIFILFPYFLQFFQKMAQVVFHSMGFNAVNLLVANDGKASKVPNVPKAPLGTYAQIPCLLKGIKNPKRHGLPDAKW